MRSRDLNKRLNDKKALDKELIDHLKNCPSCAAGARADKFLQSILNTAHAESSFSATPFPQLKAKLLEQLNSKKAKEQSFMSKMKNQVMDHPKSSFGLAFVAIIIIFTLCVPFPYHRTVGYGVTFDNPDSVPAETAEKINNVVSSIGYGNFELEFRRTGDRLNYIVTNLPSWTAAREVSLAISMALNLPIQPEINVIEKKISSSLYAQVRERIRIKIDSRDKTDEEIAAEVEQKLREQGILNAKVQVNTGADGSHLFTINVKDSTDQTMNEKRSQLVIMSPDSILEFYFGTGKEIDIDTKGKTDSEIETEIREKLAAEGADSIAIKVETEADGQRRITVEMEKTKDKKE